VVFAINFSQQNVDVRPNVTYLVSMSVLFFRNFAFYAWKSASVFHLTCPSSSMPLNMLKYIILVLYATVIQSKFTSCESYHSYIYSEMLLIVSKFITSKCSFFVNVRS